MTTQEFNKIASKKLNSLSTQDLILEVKKLVNDFSISTDLVTDIILDILIERMLVNDFSTGADLVTDIILDILMERMPENEFISLCDSL
jgi:hypothetical protein